MEHICNVQLREVSVLAVLPYCACSKPVEMSSNIQSCIAYAGIGVACTLSKTLHSLRTIFFFRSLTKEGQRVHLNHVFFVGRCLSSVLRPDHGNNSNSKKKKKKNVLMHHYDPFNFFIFYFFYKHHIQNNSMKWSSKKMYRAHSAKERKNIVKPCFSISYAKSTNGSFQSITFFMDKKYILKI